MSAPIQPWPLPVRVALVIAAAGCMAASGNLDSIRWPTVPDRSSERAQAVALERQAAAEAKADRLQRAAQAMCEDARGPQVIAVWTPDGQVECVGTHGSRALLEKQP